MISPIGFTPPRPIQQIADILNQRALNARATTSLKYPKMLPLELTEPTDEAKPKTALGDGPPTNWTAEEFAADGTASSLSWGNGFVDKLHELRNDIVLHEKYSALAETESHALRKDEYSYYTRVLEERIRDKTKYFVEHEELGATPTRQTMYDRWDEGERIAALGGYLENLAGDTKSILSGLDSMTAEEKIKALTDAIGNATSAVDSAYSNAAQHFQNYTGRVGWKEDHFYRNFGSLHSPRDLEKYERFTLHPPTLILNEVVADPSKATYKLNEAQGDNNSSIQSNANGRFVLGPSIISF